VGQGEALLAFDEVGPARKPARGEARRQEPVVRRLPGMEWLAHRAELRFEAGCLGPGNAERLPRHCGVEPEEARAGRRGAENAHRPGGVEAEIVVAGTQRHADAAGGLVAGDKRADDLMPGAWRASARARRPGRIATEGWPGIAS